MRGRILAIPVVLFVVIGCVQPKTSSIASAVSRVFKSDTGKAATSEGVRGIGEGTAEGIQSIDTSKPTLEVIRDIADTVVPIISAVASVIPVFGPIIAGAFNIAWGFLRGLFGGQEPPGPTIEEILDKRISCLEKMINDTAKQLRTETDKKIFDSLSELVSTSIRAELDRNQYVCDKYAFMAAHFKNATGLNSTKVTSELRIQLSIYLNDCDNFLKDTSTAFLFPQFTAVLSIPSAITAVLRMTFLNDAIVYGRVAGILSTIVATWENDLVFEMKRQFAYFSVYQSTTMNKRLRPANVQSATLTEKLLYLDRDLYPYGMPNTTMVQFPGGDTATVTSNTALPAVGNHDYYVFQLLGQEQMEFFNCFSPIRFQPYRLFGEYDFQIRLPPNTIYELRVVYLRKPQHLFRQTQKVTIIDRESNVTYSWGENYRSVLRVLRQNYVFGLFLGASRITSPRATIYINGFCTGKSDSVMCSKMDVEYVVESVTVLSIRGTEKFYDVKINVQTIGQENMISLFGIQLMRFNQTA